jgi:hypothetical protein
MLGRVIRQGVVLVPLGIINKTVWMTEPVDGLYLVSVLLDGSVTVGGNPALNVLIALSIVASYE